MRVASSVRTTRTTAFMSLEESPVSALSHNASWSLRLVMALTGSVWQTNQFSAGTGRDDEPSEVRGKLAHAVLMGQAAGRGAISRARTQSQEDGPARRHGFALRIDLLLLLLLLHVRSEIVTPRI